MFNSLSLLLLSDYMIKYRKKQGCMIKLIAGPSKMSTQWQIAYVLKKLKCKLAVN